MGTGSNSTNTQTPRVKSSKCSICRNEITMSCDYRQGRCPHVPSLVDTILVDKYKSRFYNLLKFFRKNK
jgi:hypothetical protein